MYAFALTTSLPLRQRKYFVDGPRVFAIYNLEINKQKQHSFSSLVLAIIRYCPF